jgi:hypothetical protein
MKYQREHDFDKFFAQASAQVGLPPALMKAIIAVETEFHPTVFNTKSGSGKYGLAGMTINSAKKIMGVIRETDPRGVKDPEVAILLLGHFLRFLYSHMANKDLFPEQEGIDPDMHDVIKQYARENDSGNPIDYHRKVWGEYVYFSQRSGEPDWTAPDQVDGVSIRNKPRERYL